MPCGNSHEDYALAARLSMRGVGIWNQFMMEAGKMPSFHEGRRGSAGDKE
jgi:hypothetical protein